MIKISQNQALKRWGTLPDILKESIFSAYNAEILWRVCENQHLSEDKIDKVAVVTGDVLMGFLHPEDFAQEIHEALNINIEIAKAIAMEIDRKIFSPLKKELEKVYQPIVLESEELVLDLKKKMADFSFKVIEDEVPQENKIDLKIVSASEKPKAEPITISFETPPTESISPTEPIISIESAEKNEAPKEQGPLIIHQEAGFKPLSGKLKSLGGMFNFLRSKDESKKEDAPVKAELQFGGEFEAVEEKKEEYKPEIKIEEQEKIEKPILGKKENFVETNIGESLVENNKISEAIKVVNYAESPIIEHEGKIEENKIGEKKPEIGEKKESKDEETLDLGMLK